MCSHSLSWHTKCESTLKNSSKTILTKICYLPYNFLLHILRVWRISQFWFWWSNCLLLVKTGKTDCIFYENRQENRGNSMLEKWLCETVSCCIYFLCRPITHSNKMQYISTKADWALGGCLDNINACSLYAFISSKQPPKIWHVSTEMYCILLLCNYYNTYFNDDVNFAWLFFFFFWWLQTWFLNIAYCTATYSIQ